MASKSEDCLSDKIKKTFKSSKENLKVQVKFEYGKVNSYVIMTNLPTKIRFKTEDEHLNASGEG